MATKSEGNNQSGAIDLEALRVMTEERLSQSKRLRDTTSDAGAWEDYRRACVYFEAVLSAIATLAMFEAEINA